MGRSNPGRYAVLAWVVVILVTGVIAACAPRPSGPDSTESYPLCTSHPDYGNAPCVVLSMNDGTEGYTWIAVDTAGVLVHVPMASCIREDGPAPCVWDTERGDASWYPDMVHRYLMVRD